MDAELNCKVISSDGKLKLSVLPGTIVRLVRRRWIEPWTQMRVGGEGGTM